MSLKRAYSIEYSIINRANFKREFSEYIQYQSEGYLIVRNLVPLDEVKELIEHAMAILVIMIRLPIGSGFDYISHPVSLLTGHHLSTFRVTESLVIVALIGARYLPEFPSVFEILCWVLDIMFPVISELLRGLKCKTEIS